MSISVMSVPKVGEILAAWMKEDLSNLSFT